MKHSWQEDYPTHNFDIVSAELPSGSAWLVNCLLELNVPIWQPWEVQTTNEWQRLSSHVYRYNDPSQGWQQTLPALQQGRVFGFDTTSVGRVTHRWAGTIKRGGKLVLFVRDPRDMLYSQWRRSRYNQPDFNLDYTVFLHTQYHQYPINQIEYVLLFLMMWKSELNHFNALIIKFEDYKLAPVLTLNKVLKFLGLKRSEEAISDAIKASDFKVLKKLEDELAVAGLLQRKYNFLSQSLEYNSYMDSNLQKKFYSEFNLLSEWLGYAPFNAVKFSPSPVDDEWLAAMADCVFSGETKHVRLTPFSKLLKKVSRALTHSGQQQ